MQSEGPNHVRQAIAPNAGNDVEMTGATRLRRLLIAAVLAVAITSLVTTRSVNAVTAPQSIRLPLLVTGVPGTPLTFVVSAKSLECASEPCLQLQRTSDNGAHFTTLQLPPIALASGSSLGDLSQLIFTNSSDGYASLDKANSFVWYETTDGAESWHRVSVTAGESIVQLVPTHRELYAVVAHCVKKYTCTDYRLARSAVGASTWATVAMPTQSFKAGFTLAAFGSNVWINLEGPGSPLLFTSHDEGRTFVRSASPLASVYNCKMTPMSPKAVWAECPTGMDVSFFHSSDGGVHWISISRYAYGGTGGGAFDPVSSSLAYLNFGIFTTRRGKDLYVITDSGHEMTAVGNLACASTDEIVFSDATRGLAICQKNSADTSTTYLLRTTDGGKVWTKVSLS
jgi:photosystem II stability/assembly factor-like uncharacterized protein